MDVRLEDRAEIADLMTGWIHRDLGEWDELRNLFHDDATIEITWSTEPPESSSTPPGAWAPQT